MLLSHKRALLPNYVFKSMGHSLNPLLDANILSVPQVLDHVRQQKKVGNIFYTSFNKHHVNIYLYLL